MARPKNVPCEDHKNYKGAHLPKQPCLSCMRVYFFAQPPKEPVTCAAMVALLDAMWQCSREENEQVEKDVIATIVDRLGYDSQGDLW